MKDRYISRRGRRVSRIAVPLIAATLAAGCTSEAFSSSTSGATSHPSATSSETSGRPILTPTGAQPSEFRAYIPVMQNAEPGPVRQDGTPVSHQEVNTNSIVTNPAQFRGEQVCFSATSQDNLSLYPNPNSNGALDQVQLTLPDGSESVGFYTQINPLDSSNHVDHGHMLPVFIPAYTGQASPDAAQTAANAVRTTHPELEVCGTVQTEPRRSIIGTTFRNSGDNSGSLVVADGIVITATT